jgi:hypothetical protein
LLELGLQGGVLEVGNVGILFGVDQLHEIADVGERGDKGWQQMALVDEPCHFHSGKLAMLASIKI